LVLLDKLYPLENFALDCIFSVSNANFLCRQLLPVIQILYQRFLCPKTSQFFDFLMYVFSTDLNSIFSDSYSL